MVERGRIRLTPPGWGPPHTQPPGHPHEASMNPRHPRPSRLFDFVLGTMLSMIGVTLMFTLIAAPLGIPMFAAGLALLLRDDQEKNRP